MLCLVLAFALPRPIPFGGACAHVAWYRPGVLVRTCERTPPLIPPIKVLA